MEKISNKGGREANFLIQGTILAAAGIVVRLIGLLYRVPMTNIIGNEGMGYYATAFNVYNIMLILSSYSLPVAVSKMVSVRMAKGQYKNSVKVLKAALFYATIVGGSAFLITWYGAEYFAVEVFKAPMCIYALKVLAPTIWLMAYLGVIRGYFQGHGTMVPTACSQIFEQVINAVVSIAAATYLFQQGLRSKQFFDSASIAFGGGSENVFFDEYPQALGAAGGTLGTGMGALAAFVFLLFLFILYQPILKRRLKKDRSGATDSYGVITTSFLVTVLPVIVSSTVYNVNSVIDNAILAQGMEALGRKDEYIALWGVYSNKYLLLVHVPLAMANSLASSLIPSISRATAIGDRKQVIKKANMVIRFAMLIAIPSAVGLAVLAEPINTLLFRSTNNEDAVKMLIVGSSAVVFLSLSTVTNAILQGINHTVTPLINALISLVLHVAALYVMLMYMNLGIYSVLYASLLFAVLMCIFNNLAIRHYLRYQQEFLKSFFLPLLASLIMGGVTFGIFKGLHLLLKSNLISTLVAIAGAVFVYGVLLFKLRCVEEDELYHMPGGTRLLGLARKLHII